MRPRTTSKEWAKRVRAWRRSGEPARPFACARGWSPQTLRWWAWRLGRPATATAVSAGFVQLVEAESPPDAKSACGVEVVLSRGRTVRVGPGADLDLLRAVVETLERP